MIPGWDYSEYLPVRGIIPLCLRICTRILMGVSLNVDDADPEKKYSVFSIPSFSFDSGEVT